MPKIKNIIIILSILLVVALIILLIIMVNANNQDVTNENEIVQTSEESVDTTLKIVTDRSNYYSVSEIVGQYYSYYSTIYNLDSYFSQEDAEAYAEAEQENTSALYNMLDTEYIANRGITEDNIESSLTEIKLVSPEVSAMYVSNQPNNIDVYVVEGKLKESVTSEGENFRIIVKLDHDNNTFSIVPQDYASERYGNIELGQNVSIETLERIQKNNDNSVRSREIDDETYVKDLFGQFKRELLYAHQDAYEHLDEEYRTKKFGTMEEFDRIASSKTNAYQQMTLTQFQKVEEDGYTQYVLVDQNGKYYIFNENGVMNYSVILDTYTIDLPEFLDRYNSANDSEKAGFNVQKILDSLNDRDYKYAYGKLDETFKQNNFKTLKDFEDYWNKNLYEQNDIIYDKYENSGDLHIYTVTIKDKNDASSQAITKNFIVKLTDGTNFVMSFNV